MPNLLESLGTNIHIYTCQSLPNLVHSLDTNRHISTLVAAQLAGVSACPMMHIEHPWVYKHIERMRVNLISEKAGLACWEVAIHINIYTYVYSNSYMYIYICIRT